ncbi:hypothetical protein OROMI_024549 [Orobanche minor]
MALVSGRRSTLNPNAPLYIPAAVRQVEDFSPEWWNLVTTATWFRDYWISEHRGEDIFGEEGNVNDAVRLLPDSIDLGVDEDILDMEAQFEEFLQSSEGSKATKGITEDGVDRKPKRRALIIGVVDDLDAFKLLREALIKHLGFVKAGVPILCSHKPYVKPTKEAIRKEVKFLSKSTRARDFYGYI